MAGPPAAAQDHPQWVVHAGLGLGERASIGADSAWTTGIQGSYIVPLGKRWELLLGPGVERMRGHVTNRVIMPGTYSQAELRATGLQWMNTHDEFSAVALEARGTARWYPWTPLFLGLGVGAGMHWGKLTSDQCASQDFHGPYEAGVLEIGGRTSRSRGLEIGARLAMLFNYSLYYCATGPDESVLDSQMLLAEVVKPPAPKRYDNSRLLFSAFVGYAW